MRRIKMNAGNRALRNRNRRWMRASAAKQLGQEMGMRAIRAFAVRRRNRLIDLGSPYAGDEHAMWACFEYGLGRGIIHIEN
jgi:hypothetical protein